MAENSTSRISESLQRFSGILTDAEIQQLLAVQDAPLPSGLRLNTLKMDSDVGIQDLAARYGWQVSPIPFCEHAWTVESAGFPPGRTIEHRLGGYYLQDAASMVPVSLMDFRQQHPLILDMAASPGGKTTHLIDRTHDQGFILANDASQSRIPALRSVLAGWGGINFAVTNFPGEAFGNWFPEMFDTILLDAPCSMENLRPTPGRPLRETTHDERLRLQERQVHLLLSGLSALKIGGQIVYATCSLAPEEDEAVINRALSAHPNAFIIEDVSEKIPFHTPGLTAFAGGAYHPSLRSTLRLWPHLTGMSGFFCALLKKVNPIADASGEPPSREFSRTHLTTAHPDLHTRVVAYIASHYGLDLPEIIQIHQAKLFTRHDRIYLIPTAYLENFETLPFEFIGMALGQWEDKQLQPSHEFISRFGHRFTSGKILIEDDQVDTWVAGRDIRHPHTDLSPVGQYLLVVDRDGRTLGLGKLLQKRLRNMLPRTLI